MYPSSFLSIRQVYLKYKYKHKDFADIIGTVGSRKKKMTNRIIGE